MADAVEEIERAAGSSKVAKDLFSGAVGGVAQVLIGESHCFLNILLTALSFC